MIEKRRGYNAIYLPWKGIDFPNNRQPSAGVPELSWDEFGAQLRAAGVTLLRVKASGRNGPLGQPNVPSFEPTLGQFNQWGGELEALVQMCLKYGIGIHAIPFEFQEFETDDGWGRHAWNTANGGILSDRSRVLIDQDAIDAAKARIDAIERLIRPVVCSWEVGAEWTYLFTQEFFNTDWAGLQRIVMEQGVPWMTAMAQHIHSISPAPVGSGIVDKIDKPAEFKNELHRAPGLDFALINWYGDQDVSRKMPELRAAQVYTKLPVYVEQYAPWNIGGIAGYERDDDPFPRSKAHEWAAVCGEYGCVGPMRWPEASARSVATPWWGVAHPNMAAIAGVTAEFAAAVDLDDWGVRGQAWDTRIAGDNLSFIASWGNGRHVTAFLDWSTGGTQVVDVSGVTEQFSIIKTFDFLTGKQTGEQVVETIDGTALFTVPTVGTRGVFYLSPFSSAPVPVYTLKVTATVEMDGQGVRTFAGTLQEV